MPQVWRMGERAWVAGLQDDGGGAAFAGMAGGREAPWGGCYSCRRKFYRCDGVDVRRSKTWVRGREEGGGAAAEGAFAGARVGGRPLKTQVGGQDQAGGAAAEGAFAGTAGWRGHRGPKLGKMMEGAHPPAARGASGWCSCGKSYRRYDGVDVRRFKTRVEEGGRGRSCRRTFRRCACG